MILRQKGKQTSSALITNKQELKKQNKDEPELLFGKVTIDT